LAALAAPPLSTGKMLSATGFAYAPNTALTGRLAAAAEAEGKLVLGDALDAGMLACLEEVPTSPLPPCMQFGDQEWL
jgi:hypothetical protein